MIEAGKPKPSGSRPAASPRLVFARGVIDEGVSIVLVRDAAEHGIVVKGLAGERRGDVPEHQQFAERAAVFERGEDGGLFAAAGFEPVAVETFRARDALRLVRTPGSLAGNFLAMS